MSARNLRAFLVVLVLFIPAYCGSSTTGVLEPWESGQVAPITAHALDLKQVTASAAGTEDLSRLNLSLFLHDENSTVNGTLVIDYHNADDMAFSSIPFHLYPSAMEHQSRPGSIAIHAVNTPDEPTLLDGFRVMPTQQIMWIDLTEPLLPGASINLRIDFTTVLPDGGIDRAGVHGSDLNMTRICTISSAYPLPCVYDEFDGWNTDPYIAEGDPFYLDAAFYDFTVNVPDGMIVAATGDPTVTADDGNRTTYHFETDYPVREVTCAVSRYFVVESVLHGSVNVSVFYLPVSSAVWHDVAVESALLSLSLFNESFGGYPYKTLNVVEQHAYYGGMEYPCQVYITRLVSELIERGERAPWYLEMVIAHEVAHQWWSQLVGGDCVDWGFLDEGLASWSHAFYAETLYGSWEYFQTERHLDRVRTFYSEYGGGAVVNQSNLERLGYGGLIGFIDYIQTPLLFQVLRLSIGTEHFLSGLSVFFANNCFGVATLNHLQETLEISSGQGLDWFFIPWFNNARLPDYAAVNIVYDTTASLLTFQIVDLNEPLNPYAYSQAVPVEVLSADASVIADSLVWVNGSSSVQLQLPASPSVIRLNYSGYVIVQLPDIQTTYRLFDQIVTAPNFILLGGVVLFTAGLLGVLAVIFVKKRRAF